ncbi:MAG: hypothetical protein AB7V58_11885 [Solirubrobacterales bacterium]
MASDGRQLLHRARAIRIPHLALAAVLLALAALALAALAAPARAEVVYDNPPAAGATEALGFEQSGTAELGTLVRLAGAARLDPQVRVATIVDASDEGSTDAACATAGASFALPATLSVYAANADGSPGPLLARETRTFQLPCQGAQSLAFELLGATLPPEAIFSLAFDTATSGYAPTGLAGPADAVGVALAGPAAVGATPREAEGVYRAANASEPGAAPVLGFEAAPATWEGRQPAFTVEAAAAPAPVAEPAAAAPTANAASPAPTALATPRSSSRGYRIPASKRMTLRFTRRVARIAGPGALVQVRCAGASAARCIGTLTLSAAGAVHKVPYSIGKGRRQYLVVPLSSNLRLLDGLEVARATAIASTVQVGGPAVKTKRALKLK